MRNLRAAVAIGALAASSAVSATEVAGVGWEGQGADAVLIQLDGDTRPDLVLMAYDAPSGQNNFRYKVGFNVDASGVTGAWGGSIQVPGLGWEGQGAGAATADLDGNGRPELILMAYDNPGGPNNFRYTIGWNLDQAGVATRWSNHAQVAGVGNEGQGAAVVIGQIDSNPRPDMIFLAYDNPSGANNFRYRIGFNVDTAGNASWASNFVMVPGVGHDGQGMGAALINADGDPRPDLVLMAYDAPSGQNNFRTKIGFNLDTNGVAASWPGSFDTFPGQGWEGQGAGLVVGCLDGDPRADWLIMAYDAPSGANSFRYSVVANRSNPPCDASAPPVATNLRKSITALTPAEITSLRRGFERMRSRNGAPRDSADYRRSLQYWANMHSYMGNNECEDPAELSNPGMSGVTTHTHNGDADKIATWCKCEHFSQQFLTWHRMYLYYFEQVLQAAADDTSLRLPYFDYGADGQLPLPYREGTPATNSLRIDQRRSGLNAGTATISALTGSASNAMMATTYSVFNDRLESGPHGPVHCSIGVSGCPSGYMGSIPVSANDPIFYSHHANIDRLYECWMATDPAARAPNNPAQLATSYTFPDRDGNLVTRTVASMITTAQLSYGYTAGSSCPVRPFSLGLARETLAEGLSIDLAGAVRLNRGATRIPLRVPLEVRNRILALPLGRGRSELVIEGVDFDRPPRVNFDLYLQDSAGRRAPLGVISFFGSGGHRNHGAEAGGRPYSFDMTSALAQLGASAESINLVIVPSTGIAEDSLAVATERNDPRANVRFRSVRLRTFVAQ